MTVSLIILHIVDDFGNIIRPCDLISFQSRYRFFKDNYD